MLNNINLRQVVDAFGSHCAKAGKQPAAAYGHSKSAQAGAPPLLAVEAPGPKGAPASAPASVSPSPTPAANGSAPKQPASSPASPQAAITQQPVPTPAASRPVDSAPSKPAMRHCK
ncbi:hypothetical protein PINS_up001844 [Pythium insidiosum]|nr:hypothetical protein PINS_up001844 [Pythium insidiosum]